MTATYTELEEKHNAAKELLKKADEAMQENPLNVEKLKSLQKECKEIFQIINQPKYQDQSFVQDTNVPVYIKANNKFFRDRLPELDKKIGANISIEKDLKSVMNAIAEAAVLLKKYLNTEKPSATQTSALQESIAKANRFVAVLGKVQKNPNISAHNKLAADTLAAQMERFMTTVNEKAPKIAQSLPVWQPVNYQTRSQL